MLTLTIDRISKPFYASKWSGLLATLWFLPFAVANAQELPEQCVQLPERNSACPNVLYKRAPLSIESLSIEQGEVVCICMADFIDLRLEATTEQGKVDQLVSGSRASSKLNITETELLTLLRK